MINNSSDNLTYVDVKPERFIPGPGNGYGQKEVGIGPIKLETLYINNLTVDVTVVDRYGFRHVVPASMATIAGKFTIRTIYRIAESAYPRCKQLFSGLRGTPGDQIKIIIQSVIDNAGSGFSRELMVIIDHCVTLDEIKNAGNNLYMREADTVVSILRFEEAPAHPHAFGTVTESGYVESLGKDKVGFAMGLGVIMVNRGHGARPMFSFMMKQVRTIPVSSDPSKKEGFYVTMLEKAGGHSDAQVLVTTYYPLEEAKEIGIFASREEALTNGDVKLLKEEELLKLKQDHETFKIRAGQEKAEADATAIALERTHQAEMSRITREEKIRDQAHDAEVRRLKEQNMLANQNHEAYIRTMDSAVKERERVHAGEQRAWEREKMRLSEFYDNKAYKRRDFTEVLKIISITVTSMGGIYAAYVKLTAKAKS